MNSDNQDFPDNMRDPWTQERIQITSVNANEITSISSEQASLWSSVDVIHRDWIFPLVFFEEKISDLYDISFASQPDVSKTLQQKVCQ